MNWGIVVEETTETAFLSIYKKTRPRIALGGDRYRYCHTGGVFGVRGFSRSVLERAQSARPIEQGDFSARV